MSEISKVREAEEDNYQISQNALGDTVSLVEDIVNLHDLMNSLVLASRIPPNDEFVMGSLLMSSCRYHVVIACLAIERGHLTDSFFNTRTAIESCAFACRIKKHPHLAMIWLKAGNSKESYSKYRKEFSGQRKLFPDDQPILLKLKERYGSCCKKIHSSIYSLAAKTKVKNQENRFNIRHDYFEWKENDPGEPARSFLWTIGIHKDILDIFSVIFEEAINHDRTKWDINYNGLLAKLETHKARWKNKIIRS